MQYQRYLESDLIFRRSRGKARLVLGARQTGKSTLFQRILTEGALLIDLQDRSERMRLARDPEALTRALLPAGRKSRHVLIDEIQRVPALLDEIQLLLDRNPGKFTFTLTGSSARRLRHGSVNLLPGRLHKFSLSPVCLWEEAGREKGLVLPSPRRQGSPSFPPRPLEDVLLLGSLPAAFVEGSDFSRTLGTYAEVYAEEEVLREMAARNLGDYGRFLELAAVESGKSINLTKISTESRVPISTVRGFYQVLEDTLMGFSLPPYHGSGRSRILKTRKFYFFDLGVRNAVARLPFDKRLLATEGGNLFEHWVGCELAARLGYLGRSWRLSFWRTTDGAEVDYILETPKGVIPIEVKFTQNPRPADAAGIEHFIKRHPGRVKRGYLVCRCRRPEQLSRHVMAIPWENL